MSDSGEYQGSQAYGQTVGGNESVNRNTGSVEFSKTLIDLRGITKSINLRVSATYTLGTPGSFGLPKNWTFSIPYVVPGQSVTTQGRTYVIDPTWADSTGYHSGLRYVNNHAIRFEHIIPSQPLPSGEPGEYAWRFRHKDGAIDYYDAAGKLLEHDDLFGNYLYYRYTDDQAPPSRAKIHYIMDSWRQTTVFSYQPGQLIQITAPDGGQTTLWISTQGVQRVVDPEGYITSFTYITSASQTVLSTIRHPSSLQSQFVYQTLPYINTEGERLTVPAVRDHYQLDSQGTVLSHTNYRFGEATSGCTYTGYAINCRMGGAQDSLMESNNQYYRYDVLVSNLDATNSNILSASRILFNYLHLPMQEFHYAVESPNHLLDAYQATYTYDIPSDKHARSTNYAQPIVTEQLHYNATEYPPYQGMRYTTMEYDHYGCLLQQTEKLWDPSSRTYVEQRSTLSSYVETNWGGEMLETETFTDELTGAQKRILYTLTADQKGNKTQEVQYRAPQDLYFQPWKTKSLDYDIHGRVVTETVAWSPQVHVPDGSVASYTSTNRYDFDAVAGMDLVTTMDPQGYATVTAYAVRVMGGPMVRKTLPLGQTESVDFDQIGRRIEYTDPLGDRTTTSYAVGESGNTSTTTNAMGYVTLKSYDVLGRLVQLADNGDPTQPTSPEPRRVLSRTTYDSLSRVTSKTDEHGLTTTFDAYDAFNRVLAVTDPDGNVTSHVYDDGNLTTQIDLNGDRRNVTQLDGYARTLQVTKYADSGDTSIDYALVTQYVYDASDQVVTETLLQQPLDNSEAIVLIVSTTTYNVENDVLTATTLAKTDLAEEAFDSLERTFNFDIFGRVYTHTKTVQYHDGRTFDYQGPVHVYDSCNLAILSRNQLGQEERYTYDANGLMTCLTRYDGTEIMYTYDDIGRLATVGGASPPMSRSYLPNGRLERLQTEGGNIQYQYALDGGATAIIYPDGRQQQYLLDKTSRIIQDIDARGTIRTKQFDAQSRIKSRTLGTATITYAYGLANHTHGQLLGDTITDTQKNLTRTVSYDGFGRVHSVTVADVRTSETILEAIYSINSKGKLVAVQISSQTSPSVPELNYQRQFLYDGLGQLVQDTITDTNSKSVECTRYIYDGNANITAITAGGFTESRSYNAIDQRKDSGFRYDTNGRLLADDKGRSYRYDPNDQLVSAQTVETESKFDYYPNGALSICNSGDGPTIFYYDAGAINASQTPSSGPQGDASYLIEPGRRIAKYEGDSNLATYYIESQGSTTLRLGPTGETASEYQAYGVTNPLPPVRQHDFGYRQELTDQVSSLVYLRSRFYQPDMAAFITMDSVSKENRYAFCSGDPVNLFDATGHDGTKAMIAGLAVGFAVTAIAGLLTGGLAAVVFGPESILASMAAAAVSGAAGNVSGDATQARVAGERFTPVRAAEDLAAGAISGAVGAGSGGIAGRAAMAAALARQCSQRMITTIGAITSGVIGGAAGSFSASGSMSLMTGQPVFSSNTALSTLTGAVGGAAGGFIGSRSWEGMLNSEIVPVPLKSHDLVTPATPAYAEEYAGHRYLSLVTQREQDIDSFNLRWRVRDAMKLDPSAEETYDTVVVHGGGPLESEVSPSVSKTLRRPIKQRLFAQYLKAQGFEHDLRGGKEPLLLMSCYGAWSTAQEVADVLQRDVFASFWAVGPGDYDNDWVRFSPRR